MPRRRSAWTWLVPFSLLAVAARADDAPKFESPVANQVFQRGQEGTAEIPVAFSDDSKVTLAGAVLLQPNGQPVSGARFADGKLVGAPTGGPYTVQGQVQAG